MCVKGVLAAVFVDQMTRLSCTVGDFWDSVHIPAARLQEEGGTALLPAEVSTVEWAVVRTWTHQRLLCFERR